MGGFQVGSLGLGVLFQRLVVFAHDVVDHGVGGEVGGFFEDAVARFRLLGTGKALAVFEKERGLVFQNRVELPVIIDRSLEYLHVEIKLFGSPASISLFPCFAPGGDEVDREEKREVE